MLNTGLTDTDRRLGQVWHFYKLGLKKHDMVEEASGIIHELLKTGWTEEELEAEIKSDSRRRTETTWEFEKRMMALLASRPKTAENGEIDQLDEDWRRFEVAYMAEWPRFGGDYSFLEDWKTQKPFDTATLDELMNAIRTVRANPKQSLQANKYSLLAAAIWEYRRRVAVKSPPKDEERAMSLDEYEEFKKQHPGFFKKMGIK